MPHISKRILKTIDDAREEGLITDDEVRERKLLGNHGKGRCGFVVIVWKLNFLAGVKELYAVVQTEEIAKGIREQFYKEAHDYGIEPKYYITWEEKMVLWSRDVFKDRYRVYDLSANKPYYSNRTKDLYFQHHTTATRFGRVEYKRGNIGEWCVQKYNRQKRRWDVIHYGYTGNRNRML